MRSTNMTFSVLALPLVGFFLAGQTFLVAPPSRSSSPEVLAEVVDGHKSMSAAATRRTAVDAASGSYGAVAAIASVVLAGITVAVKSRQQAVSKHDKCLVSLAACGNASHAQVEEGLVGEWQSGSPMKAFEGDLGVQPPMGYWDPLNLAGEGNAEDYKRRRASELKHGRVSMLACIGYMTPEYFKFPGFVAPFTGKSGILFDNVPNGLQAIQKVPAGGWYQMLAFVGFLEKGPWVADESRAPGDIEGAGLLGVPRGPRLQNGPEKSKRLNAEIANGRLAMFSIIGMFFQDGLCGGAWSSWAAYGGSPLR